MPETRDRQVMVNLEPTIHDAMQRLLQKKQISASAYVRGLIIADLLENGLLTQTMLVQLMTGRPA